MENMKAIVLAAGKGTRMCSENSDVPKVMRLALGKPLLYYVLSALSFIKPEDTVLVVGYKKDKVMEAFAEIGYDGWATAELNAPAGDRGETARSAIKAMNDIIRGV